MKITREFCPADRYIYDFGSCSTKTGWAQVDTEQDASYFGTWANPAKLMVFNYCEGDTTLFAAESAAEFADHLRGIAAFEVKQGRATAKIDPGFNGPLAEAFKALGMADMLH